jgi:hypothetical protein
MKVTETRDIVVPIKSAISNAVFSFSEVTVSAIAIHTDVVRNGERVTGFGFQSEQPRLSSLSEEYISHLGSAFCSALLCR